MPDTVPMVLVCSQVRTEVIEQLCVMVTYNASIDLEVDIPDELDFRATLFRIHPAFPMNVRRLRLHVSGMRNATPHALWSYALLFAEGRALARGNFLTKEGDEQDCQRLMSQIQRSFRTESGDILDETGWREFLGKTSLQIKYTFGSGVSVTQARHATKILEGVRRLRELLGSCGARDADKWLKAVNDWVYLGIGTKEKLVQEKTILTSMSKFRDDTVGGERAATRSESPELDYIRT